MHLAGRRVALKSVCCAALLVLCACPRASAQDAAIEHAPDAGKQDEVWQLEGDPATFARLNGRWCRTDADCQHPALTCIRYSAKATTGNLAHCHVDCSTLQCPRGTWCGSFTHGPLRRVCVAPRTRSLELGVDAGDVQLLSELHRVDAGVRGRWAAVAMDLDLRDSSPGVVTALGGVSQRRMTIRCPANDSLLDGVAYGAGVVMEGNVAPDGGLADCQVIATGRRHLDALCRSADDRLECQLRLEE